MSKLPVKLVQSFEATPPRSPHAMSHVIRAEGEPEILAVLPIREGSVELAKAIVEAINAREVTR